MVITGLSTIEDELGDVLMIDLNDPSIPTTAINHSVRSERSPTPEATSSTVDLGSSTVKPLAPDGGDFPESTTQTIPIGMRIPHTLRIDSFQLDSAFFLNRVNGPHIENRSDSDLIIRQKAVAWISKALHSVHATHFIFLVIDKDLQLEWDQQDENTREAILDVIHLCISSQDQRPLCRYGPLALSNGEIVYVIHTFWACLITVFKASWILGLLKSSV